MNTLHKLSEQQNIPLLDLSAQYSSIKREIDEAMAHVMERSDFILGADVELFEAEFGEFCEAKHCVSVDSGLSALELVLRAWGIGPGDEVITAANTFIATALAISNTGATPVLVDVDPHTNNIDPEAIRSVITSHTRALVPVHLYGAPAEMDAINAIAAQYDLAVLEDACQAHGAKYKGRRAGSLGHAAAFSFYPGKNLGAYGDGGAIVTNDAALAAQLRTMRNYGQQSKYVHCTKGFNRRLDTLQAAVLRVKLRHMDRWNAMRDRHARSYGELLRRSSITLPHVLSYTRSAWHLYVVRSPFRDSIRAHLESRGISTGLHYPTPIHLQAAYADAGYRKGEFPITERLANEILSLPMYPELDQSLLERIAEAVMSAQGVKRAPITLAWPSQAPQGVIHGVG